MFHYGLVCSLESLTPDKPAVYQGAFSDYANQVSSIGYEAVELHLRNPSSCNGPELKQTAADAGLSFCALSTGLEHGLNGFSLIHDDPAARSAAIQRLKEHIDLAAVLDCLVVIGTLRSNIPDGSKRAVYEAYLTRALLELSDYAQTKNVMLVVESITRYIDNYLNTVPETAQYLRELNRSNVRLHIDTHSMNIEDPDLPAAVHACRDILGYVHFSDSNRRFPGGGNIDFKPIVKALDEIRYDGFVVSECLPWPDAESCARLGLSYMKALETCVQVESYRDK